MRKKRLLPMVIIGAGLVGVELVGELTEFLHSICRTYQHVRCEDITILLCEAGPVFFRELPSDIDL